MWRFAVLLALIAYVELACSQTFEVASVKVGSADPRILNRMTGGPGTSDPTRFVYESTTLANLMVRAFGVRVDQISGPDWVKDFSDRRTLFTVNGVVPAGASEAQFRLMLQKLLAERFHLAIHRGSAEFPGYDLVVAEGGPKVMTCAQIEDPASDPGNRDACRSMPRGATMTTSTTRGPGLWGIVRRRYIMSMPDLAEHLGAPINESSGVESNRAMPRVADRTGLSGTYEISLEYEGVMVLPGMTPPSATARDPDEAPTVFVAMEKELGLKLVKTKNVPVEILVIDHADKTPTEN